MYSAVVFCIYTELCKHHNYLILEYLITTRIVVPINCHSLSLACPRPWQPLMYFLSVLICLLLIFHGTQVIYCVVFCVWLFPLSRCFRGQPRCSGCCYLTTFHGQKLPRCVDGPQLLIHSSVGDTGVMSLFLVAVHMRVQVW